MRLERRHGDERGAPAGLVDATLRLADLPGRDAGIDQGAAHGIHQLRVRRVEVRRRYEPDSLARLEQRLPRLRVCGVHRGATERRGSSGRIQAPACLGSVMGGSSACWLVMGCAAAGGDSDDRACLSAGQQQMVTNQIVARLNMRRLSSPPTGEAHDRQ